MIKKMNLYRKFEVGAMVSAKLKLEETLVVNRHVDGLYFCRLKDKPGNNELAYFEAELIGVPYLATYDSDSPRTAKDYNRN